MDIMKGFKQGKDTEETLVVKENQRLALLKGLSRSIKEVQVLFANQRAENPDQTHIGDCRPAYRLCAQFEDILRHGLKPGWLRREPTFWPVVLEVSRKQAIQYIKGLQYAQTDNGRCRAWIRLAVNECSLESYINVICQNSKTLSYYYEPHAFVRNHEMVSAITQLLVGLTELTFNLTVDTASLEFEAAPEAVNSVPLKLKLVEDRKRASKGKDRKVRKVSAEPEENGVVQDTSSVGEGLGYMHSYDRASVSPTPPDEPSVNIPDVLPEFNHCGAFCSGLQIDWSEYEVSVDPPHNNSPPESSTQTSEPKFYSPVPEPPQPQDTNTSTNNDDPQPPLVTDTSSHHDIDTQSEQSADHSQSMENTLGTIQSLQDFIPLHNKSEQESILKQPKSEEIFQDTVSNQAQSSIPYQEESSSPILIMEEISVNKTLGIPPQTDSETQSAGDFKTEEVLENVVPNFDSEHGELSTEAHSPTASPRNGMEINAVSTEIFDPPERRNTNPFLPFDEPKVSVVSSEVGVISSEVEEEKRESVVSWDTVQNNEDDDDSVSSLDWGTRSRSSRDSTPAFYTRKGTNPFLDSEDEEPYPSSKLSTNPFAEEDTNPPSIIVQTQQQNRPIKFHIPPPPPTNPTNPFIDNDITPVNETSSHDNKPHLERTSSIDSVDVDTPTIERILPPLNRPIVNPQEHTQPSINIWQASNETTPSISPVSFPRDSPETMSITSSQDLLEWAGPWDSIAHPLTVGGSLQLLEDHYGGEMTKVSELVAEIGRLKAMLSEESEGEDKTEPRKKIVALQLRLQQIREADEERVGGDSSYQEVLGHRLVRQLKGNKPSGTTVCEGCKRQVRGIIRQWYMCKTCGSICHKGCISKITRRCNQLNRIKEDAVYALSVCPERGLTQQKFRCGSCTQAFNSPQSGGARLCDYSGLYHCKQCHYNNETIIPARVVHNWDFKPRKVCCRCFDLLTQLSNKPMILVNDANPQLETYVTDLSIVQRLKEDLLVMKDYFIQCRLAREAQLLQQLNQLLLFNDNPCCYSLTELQAVHGGSLLPRLEEASREYSNHIKECPLCSGKGYLCELCGSEEVLFPFDHHTSQCTKCKAVFHRSCFTEISSCPRCVRMKDRRL